MMCDYERSAEDHQMPPLLTAGFRPLFLAAAGWATLSMAAWLPLLFGEIEFPSRFDPLNWHIHEMLFGFVMATVGGFLLTAIPNWTTRAPVAGAPLAVLVALWALGRIVCLFSAMLPLWLVVVVDLAFAVALEVIAIRELTAVGNKRNYPLLAPVLLLAIANLLMHLQYALGWRLAVAVVIVLISVIAGRIVPAFTRNWLSARGIAPLPSPAGPVDRFALGTLHAGLIAWVFLPDSRPVGILLLIAAALNLARLARWRGVATLEEPLLSVLHIGYLWVVAGAALLGVSLLSEAVPVQAAIHALTAGAMGTMTLAVMTRATLGHTGRVLRADKVTMTIYALVSVAALLRIAAAWAIDAQMELYEVAALAWIGAYALFVAEYGPMLVASRR
jgi:uncharacterized protein involved in response to NO